MPVVINHLAGQREEPAQPGIADRVGNLAALALGPDKATPPQAGEMIGDTALRGAEFGNQFRYIAWLNEQEPDDGQPRRVAEGTEKPGVRDSQGDVLLSCVTHPRFSDPTLTNVYSFTHTSREDHAICMGL